MLLGRREKKAKVEKEEPNELKDEIKEEEEDDGVGSEPEAKDDPEENEIRILKHELETLNSSWKSPIWTYDNPLPHGSQCV